MKADLFSIWFIAYAIMMVIVGLLIANEILEPFGDKFNSAMTMYLGAYMLLDYMRNHKKGMKDNEIE